MRRMTAERAMRRPLSLALRLTVSIGVAATVVFLGFGWVIGRAIESHFEKQDAGELEVLAQAVRQELSAVRAEGDLVPLRRKLEEMLAGHHGVFLYIARADGRTLFASPGADLATMARTARPASGNAPGSPLVWKDGRQTYRGLVLRVDSEVGRDGQPFTVAVATAIDYHLRFLEDFHRTLWLMIASGIAIMGLMGWVAVRQGHAPLRRIIAQIRRISTSQLHLRLSPDTVLIELADLAVSFNEMLERVEEAFRRLSNFSADIAHELRTPVTNLMTQTQVALSNARSIEEYRETLYSNLEEYERIAQMIGDMLFLAKAENGLYKPSLANVNLVLEVQALFDYFEAWAEERGVLLALEGAAAVPGDRLMLRRALSNLLSNAIRHTPSGQTVVVRLAETGDDAVEIVVENPGTDIPPEHLPRLFDRFYRWDSSRQRKDDGVGLGLAIVKSIVDAHGGSISVVSAEGRTRFKITLPKQCSSDG